MDRATKPYCQHFENIDRDCPACNSQISDESVMQISHQECSAFHLQTIYWRCRFCGWTFTAYEKEPTPQPTGLNSDLPKP